MGASKTPKINRELQLFEEELKDENTRFINKYDEALSHLILAGSDIILCQSFHDAVLQVPLKAVRYGAAPVAITFNDKVFRNILEHDPGKTKFAHYMSTAFANLSLSQALDEIKNKPSHWNMKIMDAMSKDFSWDAECYDIHISAYASIKNL